ncbi:hypothetical protein HPG69_012393, partial [Diceros bicornis minor]
RGRGRARRRGAAAPSPFSLRRLPRQTREDENVRGKSSQGGISTIRSASTPPRAVKSSVRPGERKAARRCLDPRETLLFFSRRISGIQPLRSAERPGGGGCFSQLQPPAGARGGEERGASPLPLPTAPARDLWQRAAGRPWTLRARARGTGGKRGWSGRRTAEPGEGRQCGRHVKPSQPTRAGEPGLQPHTALPCFRARCWAPIAPGCPPRAAGSIVKRPLFRGRGNARGWGVMRLPARGQPSPDPAQPHVLEPRCWRIWKLGVQWPVSVHPGGGVLLAGLSRSPLPATGNCHVSRLAPTHPHLPRRPHCGLAAPSSIPEGFPGTAAEGLCGCE